MSTYPLRLSTAYFPTPFDAIGRDVAIDFARHAQRELGFDTVVVTGISGVLMGGVIAHALGCNLLVLRKDDDTSTHSWTREHGALGERWAFLDDFYETGATRDRVVAVVERLANEREHGTDFVGSVYYETRAFCDASHNAL